MTALFLLLLFIINGFYPRAPFRLLFWVAVVQFVTNGAYFYLWKVRDTAVLGFLVFTIEIVLITLLILSLGPDGYIFVLAYLWPIMLGGWLIGHQAIPWLTLLSALAYTLLFMLQRQGFYFEVRLLMPDGTSQALLLSLPYMAFTAGIVWALTIERERDARALMQRNDRLLRFNRGLHSLVAAGEALLGCLDMKELLTAAIAQTRRLAGQVPVALYARDGDHLRLERQEEMPKSISPAGDVQPVPAAWLEEANADPQTPIIVREAIKVIAGSSQSSNAEAGENLIQTALRSPRGLEGMLAILMPQGYHLDQHDEQMLHILGNQLGTALANARLVGDLAHERNLLQGVLSRMSEGVFVADEQDQVLLANRAARRLLAVVADAALPAEFTQRLAQARESEHDGGDHLTIKAKGRVVQLGMVRLLTSDGIPACRLYVARDITQEAQVERMKSDFVAYASHEMRTPLTTIKMLVRLLSKVGDLSGKQREYLRIIETQVDRQTRLVSNLLDLARLEAGRYELALESVHPCRVLQSAVEGCRPLANAKGLDLSAAWSAKDDTPVRSNAAGLETVLTNLLSNAIKFTEAGGKVKASCHLDGGTFCLVVSDTGIGMTPEQLEHIFNKFYTVRHPKKTGEGTGLGLVISEMIVKQLGGQVEVNSELGNGSCFTVRLPAVPATGRVNGQLVARGTLSDR